MMFGMITSTGSKQLLLQFERNTSHIRCSPMQQKQQLFVKHRFFASKASAMEVDEPVKHTYGELIRRRNETPKEPEENSVQGKKSAFRYGHIRWIDREKRYAIIRQEVSNERIFLPFQKIDISESAQLNALYFDPVISLGFRVRFQVEPNPNKNGLMTAYDVQRWDGHKIPLLRYKNALKLALKTRAWLGHRCYKILDDGHDATTMREQITKAYEESNKSTEWARSQLTDSNTIIRECKAELGNEVFDILENIYQIDDVQTKVDNAFLRCERTLKELELLGVIEQKKDSEVKSK